MSWRSDLVPLNELASTLHGIEGRAGCPRAEEARSSFGGRVEARSDGAAAEEEGDFGRDVAGLDGIHGIPHRSFGSGERSRPGGPRSLAVTAPSTHHNRK
jgi:hypothetical protein